MMNQRQLAQQAQSQVQSFLVHKQNKKLKTLCMKTPGLMCQSGLAQTVTFLRSREPGAGYSESYLQAIIKMSGFSGDIAKFHKHVLSRNVVEYIALTAKVQRSMEWLRRFAQIEMKDIQEQGVEP
jgi:CRISPR/Cas system CMR-associated protein Cmr5 small subunit